VRPEGEKNTMPRGYPPEKRIATLKKLAENNGHFMNTSWDTGVPASTIRYWAHRAKRIYLQKQRERAAQAEATGDAQQQIEKNLPQQQQQQQNASNVAAVGADSLVNPHDAQQQNKKKLPQQQQQQQNTSDDAQKEETALPVWDDGQRDDKPNEIYVELKTLRDRLMTIISGLSSTLTLDDPHVNQRTIAMTRLLDRILKLDAQLAQMEPDNILIHRIVYQYPDESTHDIPIWQNTDWLTENREEHDSHFPNNNNRDRTANEYSTEANEDNAD
jgi:hypothetical protein